MRTYTQEIADAICARLASGESLRKICAEADGPGLQTVMDWLGRDAEFRDKYARAREDQADAIFETMSEVEDKVESGEMKSDAARVILESRRWRAEKLKPKVYGRKQELELKGSVTIAATPLDEQL